MYLIYADNKDGNPINAIGPIDESEVRLKAEKLATDTGLAVFILKYRQKIEAEVKIIIKSTYLDEEPVKVITQQNDSLPAQAEAINPDSPPEKKPKKSIIQEQKEIEKAEINKKIMDAFKAPENLESISDLPDEIIKIISIDVKSAITDILLANTKDSLNEFGEKYKKLDSNVIYNKVFNYQLDKILASIPDEPGNEILEPNEFASQLRENDAEEARIKKEALFSVTEHDSNLALLEEFENEIEQAGYTAKVIMIFKSDKYQKLLGTEFEDDFKEIYKDSYEKNYLSEAIAEINTSKNENDLNRISSAYPESIRKKSQFTDVVWERRELHRDAEKEVDNIPAF
jgi:hypothetical protein